MIILVLVLSPLEDSSYLVQVSLVLKDDGSVARNVDSIDLGQYSI